jgi:hypothetical protein
MSATVPSVVARQDFLSQTSNLATTTLFTPSASGLFRVTVYGIPSGPNITVTIGWTDDDGANSFNPSDQAGNGARSGTVAIRSTANPITIAVTRTNAPTWNLSVVVEDLN